ncbi:MAG: hypothetical protein N3G21_03865, partial [Candidatus Hydrogenedentes bacterium]|nr:hypothetical protein [Candidatus Hydrogenedentota bacterium]
AQNGFGLVEDWFISPETMIRNIHWGTKLKQSILKDFQNIYQLWNCLGIAPHTPNLLNSFSILGSVSNFSESLTYPICMVYPPAGNPIYIRNLAHTPNIFSLSQIQKWFYISHYPVKDLLPEIDILVLENYFPPPLPALQTDLSMYIPPYFIQGNGSSEFFQEIDDYLNNSGKISSLPTLKTCIFDTEKESKLSYEGVFSHLLTKLETSTIQTEKLSTLASLAGGDFPNKLLASLWCNLLLFSNSDFLKGNLSPQEYLISLMNLTQLCAIAEKQKVEALTKIADNTNTLAYSPIPNKEPIPIIIFNSNSNTTSAPVFINLNSLPNFPNGKLFTADGKLVPFLAHLKSPKYSSISYKTLEFVAEEVPPFGTKIYLWIPESHNPKEILTSDLFIENKYYLIKFDHSGNITEIIHKDSNDSLNLINEGIDTLGILNSDLNEFKPITEIPISIKSFKSELKQRIEIEFGAELGKVVKEYTLYHNLPYIYCSHNLSIENQNDDNIILCTRFSPDVSNNFVLTGAPLFALHRNLRTHKLVPIKGFIASGVTKFLTTKSKGTYPLSEFTVIKTNSEIDYSILRNAMWKMGIPSGELVLNVDKPSSKLANIANTLFIWAGNLKELENLKKLLDIKLSNDIYQEMGKREEIGTPFIINCGKGNSLLGFLASDNIKINLLMENFTNILTKHSEFLLPDSLTEINSPNSNENRIVVLFEGTKFAKSGKKEEMYIIHGKYQMKPLLSACISSSLSYRIVPFSKKIELTKLLKLANEEPLLGIVTTSHGGQWLPNSSFLNLSSEKVTILSIQPTGFTHPFVQEEYPNPKTFCNLRIASISEEESRVKIESVLGVKSPALMGISEKRLENQFSQNQDVNLKSWEINTIRLAFDKIRTIGNPSNTASQSIETPLVFETLQYPLTNFCPVKLGLKLNPTLSRPKVELTISNLSAFEEISGTVYLEVSREESIGPNEISYTLPPLSTAQHFLDYISSNPTETAYIRAWTDAKGFKTFAYILPEQPPCKVNIHRETNKILVDLENIMPVTVNGIILCFATQNELANHNLSYILPILPEYANFELHPHSKQQFTFALFDDIDDSKMLVYIRVCNYQEIFTVDKTLKIAGNINKHNPGN